MMLLPLAIIPGERTDPFDFFDEESVLLVDNGTEQ
jgi:hypothetical protein